MLSILQNHLLNLITSVDALELDEDRKKEADYSDTELLVNNLEEFSNIVEEENPNAFEVAHYTCLQRSE